MPEPPWRLEKRAAPSAVMRVAAPLIAAAAMLASGFVIFGFLGKPPLNALHVFFIEPLNSLYGWGELLLKATPLALCGLGLAVGFAANVWNIGAEGQLTLESNSLPTNHQRHCCIGTRFGSQCRQDNRCQRD